MQTSPDSDVLSATAAAPIASVKKQRRSYWRAALVIVGVALAGGVTLTGIALGAIKGSDAYRTSRDYLTDRPAVVSALGAPIDDGFFPTGSVKRNGDFGSAELSFDLKGSRAQGRALVSSHRDGQRWVIDRARLQVGNELIELTP